MLVCHCILIPIFCRSLSQANFLLCVGPSCWNWFKIRQNLRYIPRLLPQIKSHLVPNTRRNRFPSPSPASQMFWYCPTRSNFVGFFIQNRINLCILSGFSCKTGYIMLFWGVRGSAKWGKSTSTWPLSSDARRVISKWSYHWIWLIMKNYTLWAKKINTIQCKDIAKIAEKLLDLLWNRLVECDLRRVIFFQSNQPIYHPSGHTKITTKKNKLQRLQN